jgi:hypothetical protein
LLGKRSATWTTTPVLWLLVYFSDRVSCFCLAGLNCDPLVSSS